MSLLAITWDVSPEIIEGWRSPNWYGLLFASGFFLGYMIVRKMFRDENIPEKWLDKLLMYVMIATIIGARLGHVFFYDWSYYSAKPEKIIAVWEGGLASHGAVIGIIFALWLYSKRVSKKSILWILDRVVVPIAIAGCFIRLGNLMNSEIIGIPTGSDYGFIFTQLGETFPRHPAQLYESVSYLLIFILLFYMFWKTDAKKKSGLLFGVFLTAIFTARFIIEFIKEGQADRDAELFLNTGQLLSIPAVLIGLFFVIRPWILKSNKAES